MPEPPIPVLLLTRDLNLGGIERDISKAARMLHRYGITPHVASFRKGGMRWLEIEAAGVPMLHLPVTSFKSSGTLVQARRLYTYLRSHEIRVVHAYDPGTTIFGAPVARLARVPAILTSQLCYPELNPTELRKLLRWMWRRCDGLFVNCHAIEDYMAKHEGWKRDAIHVCHNGFEPAEFHAEGRHRPDYLQDASVVIGTVAVLREEKNLEALIEAFAAIKPHRPGARLLIVGSGAMQEKLEQRIAELGIAADCIMHPATNAPADLMRAMDIFVLSSRSEAFPNALLEAMACGCCPVASDVGGTPELIVHGERGYLFEKGNAVRLAEVLLDITSRKDLVRTMGVAAASFARENLTMEIAAARLAGIYKALLKKRQAAGRTCPE